MSLSNVWDANIQAENSKLCSHHEPHRRTNTCLQLASKRSFEPWRVAIYVIQIGLLIQRHAEFAQPTKIGAHRVHTRAEVEKGSGLHTQYHHPLFNTSSLRKRNTNCSLNLCHNTIIKSIPFTLTERVIHLHMQKCLHGQKT